MKQEEYYHRLEKAIEFELETNIDKKFQLSSVSKNAFSSLSHFHRIFYFMTGMTIKEYIRHRRLSNAAIQLITTKRSVLDIAFEAKFESPESLNKAFKKLYQLSPRLRNKKPEFQVIRKIEFNHHDKLKQPDNMELAFVYLPQQLVMGVKTRTSLESSQQTRDIPIFFEKVTKTYLLINIPHTVDQRKIFGIYSDMSDDEAFDYTVGLFVEKVSALSGCDKYVSHMLPATEYARFSVHGAATQLEAAWRYIYGTWMPNSGRSRRAGLDFEIYYPERTDIYIPMVTDKAK